MNSTHGPAVGERPAVPPVDLTRAARATRGAAGQLVAMLRAVSDPDAAAIGHWTVRDVAAHIAGGAELYGEIARGTPSPAPTIEAITALNDQILSTVGEQDLPALAGRAAGGTGGPGQVHRRYGRPLADGWSVRAVH